MTASAVAVITDVERDGRPVQLVAALRIHAICG
jgi:hypothetical protein